MNKLGLFFLFLTSNIFGQPHQINWWHSMSGELGKTVDQLVKDYNSSQKNYKVIATYRGNYTENLNAAIAAYRGKKQPHIVQVFEVGTLTMMNSNAIYPVYKLFADNNIKVNWDDYLDPVVSYYQDQEGNLLSLPFNSSTPILYYNEDILKKSGFTKPPETWEELFSQSKKIVSDGNQCGAVIAWQSWILLENFSSIHNLPFSDNENGFKGTDVKLTFNNQKVIQNINSLKEGLKSKIFSYEGRRSDPAKSAFFSQKCAFMMDTSSSMSAVRKLSKFKWSATTLPHYKDIGPKNSIIGGATLWTFKGHKKEEYLGVADFFKFIASDKTQQWWHKQTGYLPITKSSYKKLKESGYYDQFPEQEVAVSQLLRGTPGKLNRGIRLGGFTQIRELINEELEKIWSGRVSTEEGLNNAVKRGNLVLKQFNRTMKRRSK
ncbi:MAG: sn-glycerol-3-phosphate ABC transporter substrate-binding protein UgpB [Halobacteriovoraceae bacterium]|nr:sn-glycerol-3-phosphate ABC transporter substrate-binding protein UgpB [Halobacteriovoraceae bacterium]